MSNSACDGPSHSRTPIFEACLRGVHAEAQQVKGAVDVEVRREPGDGAADDLVAGLAAVAIGQTLRDRRHVGRVGDDAIERSGDGRVEIAADDVDRAAVQPGVEPREVHGSLRDVGGGAPAAGRGHRQRGNRRPGAELEHRPRPRRRQQRQELARQRRMRGKDDVGERRRTSSRPGDRRDRRRRPDRGPRPRARGWAPAGPANTSRSLSSSGSRPRPQQIRREKRLELPARSDVPRSASRGTGCRTERRVSAPRADPAPSICRLRVP